MAATMIAILSNANFLTVASFPVEMTSAIAPQSASRRSIDVAADIYSPPWEALARSCGGWLSIAGISAASHPIAPFPELPQDRPNLSNCDQVICNRMTLCSTRPAFAAQVAQWSLRKRGQMASTSSSKERQGGPHESHLAP
jgi:hypothetical protein